MKRFFPIILTLMLILTLAIAGCGGSGGSGNPGGSNPGDDNPGATTTHTPGELVTYNVTDSLSLEATAPTPSNIQRVVENTGPLSIMSVGIHPVGVMKEVPI